MKLLAGILAVALWATSAVADANAKANELFVEAVQLWKRAQPLENDNPLKIADKLALLQRVDANLDSIVANYPSSNLAVQLMIGAVGPLEIEFVKNTVDYYRDACVQLRRHCIGYLTQNAVRSIEHTDTQASLWAKEQIAFGDFDAALKTAQSVKDADTKAWTLSWVHTAKGDFEKAEKAALGIENDDIQALALFQVNLAADRLEVAAKIAKSIRFDDWRAWSLAEVQIASGDLDAAQEMAQSIDDGSIRALILFKERAETGDLEAALEVAQSIEDKDLRAWAFVEILEKAAEY